MSIEVEAIRGFDELEEGDQLLVRERIEALKSGAIKKAGKRKSSKPSKPSKSKSKPFKD
jgi:hypothetical protein